MEEVENIIDYFIFKGHLITSTETKIDYEDLYPDDTLDNLVILPLKHYLFNGCDDQVKRHLDSSDDALSRCTKFFEAGDTYFGCKECAGSTTCVMCKKCFKNSVHENHKYWSFKPSSTGGLCGCGDIEAWKSSPRCTCHQKSETSDKSLPKSFLDKLSKAVKHLCSFLEKIASNNSSLIRLEYHKMLDNYRNMKNIEALDFDSGPSSVLDDEMILKSDDNQKMCLLVFKTEFFTQWDIKPCLEACVFPEVDNIHYSTREINANGYSCVKYRGSEEECRFIKEKIENYSGGVFDSYSLDCRIISVPAFYFLRLSSRLIELIRELCSKKTQLCDLLTHIVFRYTALAPVYIENERFMPEIWRFDMIYNLLSLTLCSEYGKTYAVEIYLQNLDRIYQDFMLDSLDIAYCFIDLTAQFVARSSLAVYLVENGYLVKIIDCLTNSLNEVGIRKGEPIMNIFRKWGTKRSKLTRVIFIFKAPKECVMNLPLIEILPAKFRSEISKALLSMIRFCFCFDDLEPFNKTTGQPDEEFRYYYTRYLISEIHNLMIKLSKWLYSCPSIVFEMLDEFINKAKNELATVSINFGKLKTIQDLISYSDIETKDFSMFNLSRRFFVDTLMRAVMDPTAQIRQKFELVVKDLPMLIWLSLPSVVAISSYLNNFYTKWYENSEGLKTIYQLYRNPCQFHYFYLQDLTCIQILMSYMPPDQFLKFLLFSVYPTIREKSDYSHPISSILTATELKDDVTFRELLVLIYNCISERHYIGMTSNYKYFLIERQLIHYLALGDQTYENVSKEMRSRGGIATFVDDDVTNYLNEALERVSSSKTCIDGDSTFCLKPENCKQINIYYFVYPVEISADLLRRLVSLCDQEKYVYEPPEIVELRSEFLGMGDFIVSPGLLELVMQPIKRISSSTGLENYMPTQDLLVSLMCLCFITKSTQTTKVKSAQLEPVDSNFLKYNEINGQNINELLANIKAEAKCPVLSSVIDYLITPPNGVFKAKNIKI